jgi:RNA polymerase sigma-70 factor, ECF subfamily
VQRRFEGRWRCLLRVNREESPAPNLLIIKYKSMPKTLILTLLAALVLAFALPGDAFLYAVLPTHASELHVSAAWVGFLLSINRFARLFVGHALAVQIGRFGFKHTVLAAAALAAFSTLLYGLVYCFGTIAFGFLFRHFCAAGWHRPAPAPYTKMSKNMEIATLHTQFHRALRRYVISKIGNRADVSDLLQEIFLKIAGKIDSLQDEEKIAHWVFAVARNAVIDYYRKKPEKVATTLPAALEERVADETDFDTTKGLEHCLDGFIRQLPPEYRDIILDSEIKGIKQKDLAEKYRLAYPSVRSRVQRGRRRLKAMLLDCCAIETDKRGNVLNAALKGPPGQDCGMCN